MDIAVETVNSGNRPASAVRRRFHKEALLRRLSGVSPGNDRSQRARLVLYLANARATYSAESEPPNICTN